MSEASSPSKASPLSRVLSLSNAIGTIIAVVAVLKIIRQNMPNMALGELLSFLVTAYRKAIYPVFDFLFDWLFALFDFQLTDFARDATTVYLILAAALFRGGFVPRLKRYYADNPSGLRKHFVAVAMVLIALLWIIVIPLIAVLVLRKGQRLGIGGFRSWAIEVGLICGGVVVAMLANLVV